MELPTLSARSACTSPLPGPRRTNRISCSMGSDGMDLPMSAASTMDAFVTPGTREVTKFRPAGNSTEVSTGATRQHPSSQAGQTTGARPGSIKVPGRRAAGPRGPASARAPPAPPSPPSAPASAPSASRRGRAALRHLAALPARPPAPGRPMPCVSRFG